jgi:hypothetical protein
MIAERISKNIFSIGKSLHNMSTTKIVSPNLPPVTTEYVSLEERVARSTARPVAQERSHPRVEAFQQHTQQLALKVMEHVQLCVTFLKQPTDERHTEWLAHKDEIDMLWQAIEAEQRALLNDSSMEQCHRERFERYSQTAANLFLLSRIGIHFSRFMRLANPNNVFLVRAPLCEMTQQLLQSMVPLIESLLRHSGRSDQAELSIQSAREARKLLATVLEKHESMININLWRPYLQASDLRLLQAAFHAFRMGHNALQSIAEAYSEPLPLPQVATNNASYGLLRPL